MKLGVAGTLSPDDYASKGVSFQKAGLDKNMVMLALREVYLANQVMMQDEYEEITRGMGTKVAGMTAGQSDHFAAELTDAGVKSLRFGGQRAVSGFASGDKSTFGGWTITTKVAKEAVLSSFNGLRIQRDNFAAERETLVIGAAELSVPVKNFKYRS
jgi:hypothetical protein